MTKGQKEAIDRIKYNDIATPLYCGDITICNIDDLKTVLSILEENDNRIKQLENMNKFQNKDIKKAVDYTFELNKEIEFKDKIIDLMAGKIYEEGIVWNNKEEVKQYFENKAKERR